MMGSSSPKTGRATFPPELRLRSKRDFAAVFEHSTRVKRGPIVLLANPNGLAFSRLGISTPKKIGNRVRRNRIRRLLRESYRLLRQQLPTGYDWVIIARAHEPLKLANYQELIARAMALMHQQWQNKLPKQPEKT